MIVKISKTLIAASPSNEWIRGAVSERIKYPLPEKRYPPMGGRISYYVDKNTSERLDALALETGRRTNEIFTSCLIDVLGSLAPDGRAPVVGGHAPAAPRKKPRIIKGPPKIEPLDGGGGSILRARARWLSGLEERRAIIRADIAVGRWGVFSITGGNPAIKPDEQLDAQGARDFDDEIQQGMVVQELIPWEYSEQEALAWLARQQRRGKPLSWYYISGDSESLNDAQESRRRGELRADNRFPEMVEQLARVEHEEALEREAFGRKRCYLDWAVRDRDRLLQIARRDGVDVEKVVPRNLARLAAKAEDVGLLGSEKVLRLARESKTKEEV